MRILGLSFFFVVMGCSGGGGGDVDAIRATVDARTANFESPRASWGSYTESPCVVSGHTVSATNGTEQIVIDFPAALGEHDCRMMLLPRSSSGYSSAVGTCRVNVLETGTNPGARVRGTFTATLEARKTDGMPVATPAQVVVKDGTYSAILATASPCSN
jgi:hypothetical protein